MRGIKINYATAIVICLFLTTGYFLYGEVSPCNNVHFTIPKNYDPTQTLSLSQYKEGELIICFAPKEGGIHTTIDERTAILSDIGGGVIKHTFKLVPGLNLIELPYGVNVEEVLGSFNRTEGILYAQPNYLLKPFSTFPNDPRGPTFDGGEQWGLNNMGQTGGTRDADIDAPEAWDITTDSNIIVAVIDSGVSYNHPDLAANMWVNQAEYNGTPGQDDDNNGYEDDIYGYDFYNNDGDPNDDYCHGTHCAGIIGAVGNNSEGVTGVCWNVKIMALKFIGFTGYCTTSDAIECIEYAIEQGAKVLSNSYGWYNYNPALLNEIEIANASGVLFIAAVGNDGSPYAGYPARFDCNNIISVMATDANDKPPSWSNWGANSVDLAAPGTDILSTFPTYTTDFMDTLSLPTDYCFVSGTSMSAPFVAGACALVWSIDPSLTHLQVKEIIMNSVDVIPDLNDNPEYGKMCVTGGRLNLFNALRTASKLPLDKVDDINEGVMPGDYITYTISYGNPVNDPCDPNFIGDVNDVVITDFLTDDLVFSYASGPNSTYNPDAHTVTWSIGTLEPNEANSVTLIVKVNDCITSRGAIANFCKIEGGNWTNWAREATPVLCASNPRPTCSSMALLCTGDVNLTWYPGFFAADTNGHEIYFGTNFSEVYDANTSDPNVYKGKVTNTSYIIESDSLDMDTTYYWRVDEVNPNHPDSPWKGVVWSFTTDCYLIDDFEEYGVPVPFIQNRWEEYSQNGTSAELYVELDPAYDEQSMRYSYMNASYDPYYSEATLDLCPDPQGEWCLPTDWESMNVHSLSMWFYGESTNTGTEPMYAILSDGTATAHVTYSGDMNDVKEEKWHEWDISMREFLDANSSLDLSDVRTVGIGFAEGLPADGNVYFDDIRLYISKCVPGHYPAGDFEPDCDVDFYDFAVLASSWLTQTGDGAYNEDCDLEDNNSIDFDDLASFCKDWLWQGWFWQEDGGISMTSYSFGGGGAFYSAVPPQQPQLEELSEELSEEFYVEQTEKTIEILEDMLSQFAEDDEAKAILDDWLEELEDQL